MRNTSDPISDPITPSPDDSQLADRAARQLARHLQTRRPLRILSGTEPHHTIEIPAVAATLLLRLLQDLAAGHAVTLIPIHAVLTTQQAADLLGVSRPFLIKLLESGRLPFQMVGTHRRILYKDLVAFKQASDASRQAALADLAREAQDLGLGY
jgi:excisionase family DNA binding protein